MSQAQTQLPEAEHSPSDRSASTALKQTDLRVYMMDLWSFIPYYIARLCAALRKQSVNVTLGSVRYHLDRKYFSKCGLTPDRFLIDAAGAIRTNFFRRVLKSCEYFANLFMLGVRLAISKPNILHVQYLRFLDRGLPFEIWFLRWARRLHIRVVYTVHNVTWPDTPGHGMAVFGRAYKLADALICHGEEARAELIRTFGIAAGKIRVIPHGPLFDEGPLLSPQQARDRLGMNCDGPLVLSLGVISEYKGIPFLLDAWKKLRNAGTGARLVVAGTGAQHLLSEIQEKVATEGLSDSVDLRLEFIPVEELPLLYQAADILVFPYKAGTTSGALLTGLNYGRAIVATRLPFFQEHLKDGETALLVDYGDTDALASALQTLIHEPNQRSKLAAAVGHEASLSAGWEEIARKTRECYEECCKS